LAAEALIDLPRRGIKVVLASARPPRSVRHIFEHLKLDTWQINYNGALIWDEPRRRVVNHVPLDFRTVRRIIDEARTRFPQVLITCEILDRWFTDRFDQSYTTATGRMFKPDVVAPLDGFCNQPITKLMLLGPPEIVLQLEEGLTERWNVAAVRADADLIQIVNVDVSKGTALQIVAHEYGVAMSEVMAIGDAANDVSMLAAAGVGIAMGNADERVKAVADWIAPSNEDRGVHAALMRYGLA
jgi:hypothetical protein